MLRLFGGAKMCGSSCIPWRKVCKMASILPWRGWSYSNLKGNHLSLWAAKSWKAPKGPFSPFFSMMGSGRRYFRFLHFGFMSESLLFFFFRCSVLSLILVFGLPAYLQIGGCVCVCLFLWYEIVGTWYVTWFHAFAFVISCELSELLSDMCLHLELRFMTYDSKSRVGDSN